MARPLRFVPANALVEVTTRTIQGRLLLKPSPELTTIILGVIGKAQGLYGMAIHAFVLISTNPHHTPARRSTNVGSSEFDETRTPDPAVAS
jgi:hypothetical protein